MPLGTEIAGHLPYLRRYARALSGGQAEGDRLVQQLLEAALADPARREALRGGRVPLFRAFTVLWGEAHAAEGRSQQRVATAQALLARVTPASRQALLLTAIEEFSLADAARIMDRSEGEVADLARAADEEIARGLATTILIIEDEPLIAMEIEEIVRAMGHTVCGMAATRDQASEEARRNKPGLILADIQLADGSSGLDAVDDILALAPVPVVFITAFPERLLTGARPEPTWLVTKPFSEEAVRAAISQALFFANL